MRFALAGLVLLVGSSASAGPPSWGDWVGDWEGKLTWGRCAAAGHGKATLAIDAIDGALALDLAPAGGALRALSLVEGDAGMSAQDGDIAVHVTQQKPNGVELAIDYDSGCTVRATLTRETTGIAACDRLVGWARIEARCTKLETHAPLEAPAKLVNQRAAWSAARGDALTKLAAQCDSRAAKVESELQRSGCAPLLAPTTSPQCRKLHQVAGRAQQCTALPSAVRTAAHDVAFQLTGAQTDDAASAELVGAECGAAVERLESWLQLYACP